MGFIGTVKCSANRPPATPEEIAALIKTDPSLSIGDQGAIVWTSPIDGRKGRIFIEPEQLWARGLDGDSDAQVREALDKLRSLAARLYGIIVTSDVEPKARVGCFSIIVCLVMLFLGIFIGHLLSGSGNEARGTDVDPNLWTTKRRN